MLVPVRTPVVLGSGAILKHLRELRDICRQEGVALLAVLQAKAQRELVSNNGFSD
jgi:hypothetical protein